MFPQAPPLPSPAVASAAAAQPVVVVLAAGQGSRFRGPGHKLAQPLGDLSVLGATVAAAQASGLAVVVVTRPSLQELLDGIVDPADRVLLPDLPLSEGAVAPARVIAASLAAELAARRLAEAQARAPSPPPRPGQGEPLPGMGDSIAAGVLARPHARGWLVLPGDMPLVQPASIAAVARGLEQLPIAYAQHRGRRGHPVAFGSELYSELSCLRGDEGARRLVARYPSQPVEVDDPGVLVDLDTADDLRRLQDGLRPGEPAAAATVNPAGPQRRLDGGRPPA